MQITDNIKIKIGDKIKFTEEKQRYTVQAMSKRFIICTKPMNAHKTVLYTILDFTLLIRNKDNLVFGIYDYAKKADCESALESLISGEMGVSRRGCIDINIERIDKD
jgi:hypothetical protein